MHLTKHGFRFTFILNNILNVKKKKLENFVICEFFNSFIVNFSRVNQKLN